MHRTEPKHLQNDNGLGQEVPPCFVSAVMVGKVMVGSP